MSDIERFRKALERAGDPFGGSWVIADIAARHFIMFEHSQEALDSWRNVVEEIAQEDFGPDSSAPAQRTARRILVDACQSWLDRSTPGLPGPHLERMLADDPRLRSGAAEHAMVGPILGGMLLDIGWSLPSSASDVSAQSRGSTPASAG